MTGKKIAATKRLLFVMAAIGGEERASQMRPSQPASHDWIFMTFQFMSPASPLELQAERISGISTNTCVMSAAQIAQPQIALQAPLCHCGPVHSFQSRDLEGKTSIALQHKPVNFSSVSQPNFHSNGFLWEAI